MILHTKDGQKIRGKFLQKCRNAVVVEDPNHGPRAVSVDQLRSVERQAYDKPGKNERGQPVHAKDVNPKWPR